MLHDLRKFDKMAHSSEAAPRTDITLYAAHIPGQPLNSSGVDDPSYQMIGSSDGPTT